MFSKLLFSLSFSEGLSFGWERRLKKTTEFNTLQLASSILTLNPCISHRHELPHQEKFHPLCHTCTSLASGVLVPSVHPLSQASAPGIRAVQDHKPLHLAHAWVLPLRADREQKWPCCHRCHRGAAQHDGSRCHSTVVLLLAPKKSR